jgi:chorismate mutase/prephenate dehydratase
LTTIEGYREQIDDIDRRLIELFEKRVDLVLNIAELKKKNNIKILQKAREEQIVLNAVGNLRNKNHKDLAQDFINQIMRISREYQEKQAMQADAGRAINRGAVGKIGCQGTYGSFSEEALIKYFGGGVESEYFLEFEDVFEALKNDEIEYAVLPIENSYTGGIAIIYDLLEKYNFYIAGEICVSVRHNLIGAAKATADSIKEVYSHSQGFEQSSEFLKKHKNYKLIPYYNTALSAEYVSRSNDITKAAIAGKRAAEIYDLSIIEENIQNKDDNKTRFIIVSKELIKDDLSDKVSVVFSMDHKSGTLYSLLGCFAENNLNLVKVESRPKKDKPWSYVLYLDFEGNIKSENTQKALLRIADASAYFRLLGSYASDCD